jgi:hypothetical protein
MVASPSWRRIGLLLHLLTSLGFLGSVAGFLALAITGAVTGNRELMRAVYVSCGIVTWDVILPLAWASLVIGIAQSLTTPWGLARYYWVLIKLVLTIIAVVVLMLQTSNIGMVAGMALDGRLDGLTGPRAGMIVHGTGGLIVLIVITILSVYKPRGLTPWAPARKEAELGDRQPG